jgi:signal peptidase
MFTRILTIAYPLIFTALLVFGLVFAGAIMGLYEARVVLTGSMSPSIPTGSAIFIRPQATYAVGDVVTYRRVSDADVTTHRIVGTEVYEGEVLHTVQGDANETVDQKPVRKNEIYGKVWVHVPYFGFLFDFFRTPMGFVLIVVIPAFAVILEQIQKVKNEVRKHKTESEPAL